MTWACGAVTNTPVGSYQITGTLWDPAHRISNYSSPDGKSPDITKQHGFLTITGALVTLSPKDYQLRPGQPKPVFETVVPPKGAFVNNEDSSVITTWPTWDSPYVTSAAIGTVFTITNKTAAVAANYTFAYKPGTVVVRGNVPPTARNDSITVAQGNVAKILVNKLLANDSSIFNDKLSMVLTEFPKTSVRGVPIETDNTKLWLFYNTLAATLDTNGYDTFTYSAKDAVGGLGTATVFVKVSTISTNYVPKNIFSAVVEDNGAITLSFLGIDQRTYRIQGTADVKNGPWTNLRIWDRNAHKSLTGLTDADKTDVFTCVNGLITATDPEGSSVSRFYRAIVNQ
jgi:hypothetical protein